MKDHQIVEIRLPRREQLDAVMIMKLRQKFPKRDSSQYPQTNLIGGGNKGMTRAEIFGSGPARNSGRRNSGPARIRLFFKIIKIFLYF